MNTKKKTLNFNGVKFFIGLDVHKKSFLVSIRSNGVLLKKMSMDPDPEHIINFLNKNYPGGEYYSAYEAGFSGFWLHRRLTLLGIKNLVVNPSDIPSTDKEKKMKSDPIDSAKIARELENGTLIPIFVPDEQIESFRTLVRLRHRLVEDQTCVKNRIKGLLNYYGVKIPIDKTHWSKIFIEWLESFSIGNQPLGLSLYPLLEQLTFYRSQVAKGNKTLRQEVKNQGLEEKIGLLMSVPGIGFISAVTLLSELGDIKRFNRFDDLASYVGLIPSTYSSGETVVNKGITPRGNQFLRHILIESAWIAIRKDPALFQAYCKLSKRMKRQQAIIRIAKKLLSRIRFVWKNNEKYVCSIVE